jgi:hypothetical protein
VLLNGVQRKLLVARRALLEGCGNFEIPFHSDSHTHPAPFLRTVVVSP